MSKFQSYKSGFGEWLTNEIICHFPSHRFRNWYLRKMGIKMSKDVSFRTGFQIRYPKRISIGNGVCVGPGVLLDARKGIKIDDNATIAYQAIIWTLNHDYNDVHFCGKGAPVHIGKYAWICSRSIILPGINVGEGAIVASAAVVTRDVPPYAIVAGVPAKVIGYREKIDYVYGYVASLDNSHFM